jgi:SAM-dependent methyltransferase
MRIYDWILGIPFVFDKIRTFILGGVNFASAYNLLEGKENDIIIDIGCGTGDALNYLKSFNQYHGFDIDVRALKKLKARHRQKNIFTYNRTITAEDLIRIKPQKASLIGLLHHLCDEEILNLLKILSTGGFVQRIATLDTIYMKGKLLNNLLAFIDRGRYVRTEKEYESLVARGPFILFKNFYIKSGNGWANYLAMDLRPH